MSDVEKPKKADKPLGIKAYGSIPHLPGSRLGPADHHCQEGQAIIATEKTRDKHDLVIVQEKLDGSCMAVAKINGAIVPLMRAGYCVQNSPHSQHHIFAEYVYFNEIRFSSLLKEGERICGEWLYQAHGTIYDMPHEPFVAFDIFTANKRITYSELKDRCDRFDIITPRLLHSGGACPLFAALGSLNNDPQSIHWPTSHGATDGAEGAIYRVERKGEVDFLIKYVRHDKVDGRYFPENNNGKILLNTFKDWRI